MPSIYQLKPAFQNLLRPLVKKIYNIGISANQVTLAAMFISVLLASSLYLYFSTHAVSWLLLLFPLWMSIRMAFNAIDGMLAREFNQQSRLGAFFNELCDVISDSALYISLIVFDFISPALLLLTIFLSILSEYAGVMAPLIGRERCYAGPMGKSDRAFWFSLITVVIVIFSTFSINSTFLIYISNSLLGLIALLLLFTIYNRIHQSIHTF